MLFHDEHAVRRDLSERWFRQLDQRRIYEGPREWLVQVTSIHHEQDVLWIQIADDCGWPGSVLLRVRDTTSVEQALGALSSRPRGSVAAYPKVVSAFRTNWVS